MFCSRITRSTTARSLRLLTLAPSQVRAISHTPHPEASHNEIKELPSSYSHYQILGITPSADAKEIKSAFRKLSKRFHPDVNQRVPTALKPIIKSNYIRILSSYQTLSDPSKKSIYDSKMNLQSRDNSSFAGNSSMHSPINSKRYSPGGINITRNKVHFGPGYRRSRSQYSSMDGIDSQAYSRSNYDVPHFDYDTHLKGNLWFERRMIQKKFIKTSPSSASASASSTASPSSSSSSSSTNGSSTTKPQPELKNEWFNQKFQNHNKKTVEAEINDTLNLQRYGGHYHRGQASYTITATPLLITGLTILSMGVYLH